MKSNILAVKAYGVFIFLFLMLVSLKAQDGNVKTYYPSGGVQSELSYINDVLEGPAVWYYENGNLKTEKYFRGGKNDSFSALPSVFQNYSYKSQIVGAPSLWITLQLLTKSVRQLVFVAR